MSDLESDDFDGVDDEEVARLLGQAYPSDEFTEAEVRKLREDDETDDAALELAMPHHKYVELDALYDVAAVHARSKPFGSIWTGHVRAVRVSLPRTLDPEMHLRIEKGTKHAFVYPWDHHYEVEDGRRMTMLSIDAVESWYAEKFFPGIPTIGRVDLITVARKHPKWRRFSPISLFLAYANEEIGEQPPIFFFLGGGNIRGRPQRLYCGSDMGEVVDKCGYRYTSFAKNNNDYRGTVTMDGFHPERVDVKIKRPDRDETHLHLAIWFKPIAMTEKWVLRGKPHFWEAIRRNMAIGQAMQCDYGSLFNQIGEKGRTEYEWDLLPPERGEGDAGDGGYANCQTTDE